MLIIFWISLVVLMYVFVGYPLLLALWARHLGHPLQNVGGEPTISILVVARNEHKAIRNKIENLLALEYPRALLQIVIASDASTDSTDAIVLEYKKHGIELHTRSDPCGKPGNLNAHIPGLTGEIVVLMDARQSVAKNSIRALVKSFSDPDVGAVSGTLILLPATGNAGDGVGFYWRYETFMRRMESQIDSAVGATGALYAIRKKLFRPIAADTLLDDLLIPMNIVKQGYRVIFEGEAVAHEIATITASSEFRRKVRTIAGNFQLLTRQRWLLSPIKNRIWLQTISHKLGRLTAPAFLLLLLLSNLLLLDHWFFQITLLTQLFFYSAALGGAICERNVATEGFWKYSRALSVPYAFCLLNLATVVGFIRFLFNRQIQWKQ